MFPGGPWTPVKWEGRVKIRVVDGWGEDVRGTNGGERKKWSAGAVRRGDRILKCVLHETYAVLIESADHSLKDLLSK